MDFGASKIGIWGPNTHRLVLYYQPTPSDLGRVWGGFGTDWEGLFAFGAAMRGRDENFVDFWNFAFPVSFAMSKALWGDS